MSHLPRRLFASAYLILVFTTACNLPASPTDTPVGTIVPENQPNASPSPTTAPPDVTPTALIPVTGLDLVTLLCQFCVNDEPHAVLVLHETMSFNVAEMATRVTCLTAQVVNGRRILLCRGAQGISFHLNVCLDGSNCSLFPLTLETCPIAAGAGSGATRPTLIPTVTPAVTSTSTRVPRETAMQTAVPSPTQVIVVPPAATNIPLPTFVPVLPTQNSSNNLADPAGFARWYFTAVWAERNYEDLWNNYLTPSFRANVGSGLYEDYVLWWNSVERVDIHSVEVVQNDGAHAWVRVHVTFTMQDGRVVTNQQYDYDLLFDPARQTWMFDYRT